MGFASKGLYVASGSHALNIEFIGAQNVTPIADGSAATNDQTAPLSRVTYPEIWGGITLAYDAPGALLRSTYILVPGADPAKIRLRYNAPVAVEPGGELRIAFATGAMRESAPVAWQDIAGRRVLVPVGFHQESEREVGFSLGPYDRTRPLTIDPTLSWNTFLGGGAGGDVGSGLVVDASGNLYVVGYSAGTWGVDPKRPWAGNMDAFVARIDTDGNLLWSTFLGEDFEGCALGNKACRDGYRVRYWSTTKLLRELSTASADGSLARLLKQLERTDLLILDDWGLEQLKDAHARLLLEILYEYTQPVVQGTEADTPQ